MLEQNAKHARISEVHFAKDAENPFETDNSIDVLVNITTGMHFNINHNSLRRSGETKNIHM